MPGKKREGPPVRIRYEDDGPPPPRREPGPGDPYRVVVAGSRRWPTLMPETWGRRWGSQPPHHLAAAGTSAVMASLGLAEASRPVDRGPLVLVHGACPTGLDRFVAGSWPAVCEAHPADWSLGRRAGPLRNRSMVRRGLDRCEVFLFGQCPGTVDLLMWALSEGSPCWATGLFEDGTVVRSRVDECTLDQIRMQHGGWRGENEKGWSRGSIQLPLWHEEG